MNNLPRILEVQNITGAVKAFDFTDEFPSKKLTFLFPEEKVEGDRAIIDVVLNTNEAPQFVSPGARAVTRGLMDRASISVRMPYIKESFFINAELLSQLREAGKVTAQSAVSKLAEELEESTRRVNRGIELLKFKALSTNYQIVLDGRLVTIENPYDTDHTPAPADWNTPTTDIRAEVAEWKQLVTKTSGRRLAYALLNDSTASYIYENQLLQTLLPGSSVVDKMLGEGVDELRLFGLTWLIFDGYYQDPWDGATKHWIPDNYVIFVPSTPDWSKLQVGQVHYVNDNAEIARDWGPVSWTEISKNPVGATVYVAWCGLAVVTVPTAVVIAKVA
jgi:hypothetical protein